MALPESKRNRICPKLHLYLNGIIRFSKKYINNIIRLYACFFSKNLFPFETAKDEDFSIPILTLAFFTQLLSIFNRREKENTNINARTTPHTPVTRLGIIESIAAKKQTRRIDGRKIRPHHPSTHTAIIMTEHRETRRAHSVVTAGVPRIKIPG